MKKILACALAISMAISLTACGGPSSSGSTTVPAPSSNGNSESVVSGEWNPEKDITIVVPYSAGGGTDNTIRALQSSLSKELGVNIIVTNEPASSGVVGCQSVADAAPDGYTLLCTAAGGICYQNHYDGCEYELEDFTPISRISVGPELICVRADSDIQTYDDLVNAMKSSTLTFGSTAVGAAAHVSLMSWCRELGVEVNYVPYSSGSEAMVALLGGHTDVCVGGSQQIIGQLANGDIRIVANLGSASGAGYEDVVIASTQGCKTEIDTFNGLLGPAGMDQAVVDRLVAAVEAAMANDDVQKSLAAAGIEMGYQGPEEFGEYLSTYNETVHEVLLSIGLIEA